MADSILELACKVKQAVNRKQWSNWREACAPIHALEKAENGKRTYQIDHELCTFIEQETISILFLHRWEQ
jgi:hypothetical protein